MWIQKSRNNLRLYERYTDINGTEHRVSVPLRSESARDYKEAVSKLMLKMAEQGGDGERLRYEDAIKKYLARDDLKDSTKANLTSTFGRIGRIIGNPYLSAINNAFVKRKLSDADVSVASKNYFIRKLKALINFAIEYGYDAQPLTLRPFKDIRPPQDVAEKYLTSEELQSVLDQLYSMDYYFTKFLALTGCRFGEASALLISDYDGNYITISKTMWRGTAQTAKTDTSNRQIYVQTELRKLMAEYLPFRKTLMIARGVRTNVLFFNKNGNPIGNQMYFKRLSQIDCNKHLHAHIFRHTHASLLAEAGYSLEAISRRLGHADSDITRKIYLHVTEKMKAKEEAQLDRIQLIN